MAEEKKVKVEKQDKPAKAEAAKKENKFIAGVKALPMKIARAFKNMWNELKRVTWPTKRKLIVYSAIVLVFMLVMGIIIGLFDAGSSALVMAFTKKQPAGETQVISSETDIATTTVVIGDATLTDATVGE